MITHLKQTPVSAVKRVVLVGAGHTHALFLLSLLEKPMAQVECLVISPLALAPYSGMIPGWLAGQYEFNDIVVDFSALCQRVGAKLVQAELFAVLPDENTVKLSNGECVTYDWLSINIGSTLRAPLVKGSQVLALRPLWTLRDRYDHCLKLWSQDTQTKPLVVTAVGAGAAGVESMLCILHRLRQIRPDRAVHGHLVSRSRDILPGFSACARRLAHKALKNAQVTIQLDCDWSDTIAVKSDVLIWATGAQAHSWQLDPACRASLQVSAEGFIQVDQSLRSVSHPNIFATGDCADLPHSLPKAGVYAVRMAATLAANIRRAVAGQTLLPFETKPYALSLLNDGAGRAIASWRHIGFSGKWVWMLKDDIDRRFINRFRLNSSAKVKK